DLLNIQSAIDSLLRLIERKIDRRARRPFELHTFADKAVAARERERRDDLAAGEAHGGFHVAALLIQHDHVVAAGLKHGGLHWRCRLYLAEFQLGRAELLKNRAQQRVEKFFINRDCDIGRVARVCVRRTQRRAWQTAESWTAEKVDSGNSADQQSDDKAEQ